MHRRAPFPRARWSTADPRGERHRRARVRSHACTAGAPGSGGGGGPHPGAGPLACTARSGRRPFLRPRRHSGREPGLPKRGRPRSENRTGEHRDVARRTERGYPVRPRRPRPLPREARGDAPVATRSRHFDIKGARRSGREGPRCTARGPPPRSRCPAGPTRPVATPRGRGPLPRRRSGEAGAACGSAAGCGAGTARREEAMSSVSSGARTGPTIGSRGSDGERASDSARVPGSRGTAGRPALSRPGALADRRLAPSPLLRVRAPSPTSRAGTGHGSAHGPPLPGRFAQDGLATGTPRCAPHEGRRAVARTPRAPHPEQASVPAGRRRERVERPRAARPAFAPAPRGAAGGPGEGGPASGEGSATARRGWLSVQSGGGGVGTPATAAQSSAVAFAPTAPPAFPTRSAPSRGGKTAGRHTNPGGGDRQRDRCRRPVPRGLGGSAAGPRVVRAPGAARPSRAPPRETHGQRPPRCGTVERPGSRRSRASGGGTRAATRGSAPSPDRPTGPAGEPVRSDGGSSQRYIRRGRRPSRRVSREGTRSGTARRGAQSRSEGRDPLRRRSPGFPRRLRPSAHTVPPRPGGSLRRAPARPPGRPPARTPPPRAGGSRCVGPLP